MKMLVVVASGSDGYL